MNKWKKNYKSDIARHIMLRYFLTILGFVAGLLFTFVAAWFLLTRFIWQMGDPLYLFFKLIQQTAFLWIPAAILIAIVIITYRMFLVPLRYLDEVVAAAERLTSPSDEPLQLSGELESVQYKLNLLREQALRSAAQAREAEQRKNDLIVYLAHDLKTPLTSVIGYLTLLRDEPGLSQEMRCRYTGIALEKAERLEDLINEFFEITRFNLTTLELEPERINLSRMLEQITDEFNPILAEKGLRWQAEIAPGIEIVADPDKLERVFDNLIRNAVNYSYPNTEVSLTLKLLEGQAVLTVQNRGKTIPPDKLGRIFDQFFRLDSARSSATGGAGLGLAISREIVERHHGRITAESADESVRFTVLLPADGPAPSHPFPGGPA